MNNLQAQHDTMAAQKADMKARLEKLTSRRDALRIKLMGRNPEDGNEGPMFVEEELDMLEKDIVRLEDRIAGRVA